MFCASLTLRLTTVREIAPPFHCAAKVTYNIPSWQLACIDTVDWLAAHLCIPDLEKTMLHLYLLKLSRNTCQDACQDTIQTWPSGYRGPSLFLWTGWSRWDKVCSKFTAFIYSSTQSVCLASSQLYSTHQYQTWNGLMLAHLTLALYNCSQTVLCTATQRGSP